MTWLPVVPDQVTVPFQSTTSGSFSVAPAPGPLAASIGFPSAPLDWTAIVQPLSVKAPADGARTRTAMAAKIAAMGRARRMTASLDRLDRSDRSGRVRAERTPRGNPPRAQ